jgi:hypothetical protein
MANCRGDAFFPEITNTAKEGDSLPPGMLSLLIEGGNNRYGDLYRVLVDAIALQYRSRHMRGFDWKLLGRTVLGYGIQLMSKVIALRVTLAVANSLPVARPPVPLASVRTPPNA